MVNYRKKKKCNNCIKNGDPTKVTYFFKTS